ncbi:MAG: neuraminidase-like domain-containing protein, partial [Candidatus Poribacteria bacterium]
MARQDRFKFKDRAELYKFFLLDVEMSGCFRTSKIVSAISSVQLYVNRCLINLEQSDEYLNPDIDYVHVDPTLIPADEWEWRKNYRVWEANRKVFLYPENYIDPTIRNNKTEIFKELEEELLQEKITKESAENSYKKYLAQFTELTKLRYAGAYYYKNKDIYYLFAHTNVQPYQYYYRTYNHDKKVWGNWKKIELAIEADEISAIVHKGKLYIFWTEVQSKEISTLAGGNSIPGGAIFKVFAKYSFLNENNKWSSPQRLYVGYTHSKEYEIYQRILGSYPPDEDKRDQMHDYVLEQFENKVFRKPYVQINSDLTTPLKLFYIWSQNSQLPYFSYSTSEFTSPDWFWPTTQVNYTLRLTVPPIDFGIININEFPISKNVTASLRLKSVPGLVYGTPYEGATINGTLTLSTPQSGTFTPNFSTVQGGYPEVHINKLIEETLALTTLKTGLTMVYDLHVNKKPETKGIYASSYGLSLSKNELNHDSALDIKAKDIKEVQDNLKDINVFPSLKTEYDTIDTETGNFFHYVEDGTSSFTNVERILTQLDWGLGFLSIRGTKVMLTTILTDELSDILFAEGLEKFLSLQT